MIKKWFNKLFVKKTPKDIYAEKLAKYIKLHGVPTGSKTSQWAETEAQIQLGPRLELYKHFDSKNEAIEAARQLIASGQV